MNGLDINFKVRWFEPEDIKALYGRKEFSNALCEKYIPERPDVLAVGAIQGDRIVGLEGCSADTELFWQVGIDILPEFRGRGMETKLVKLLKNEVFRRGAIPFYGTSLSNLHSWNIAINCGFYPAWVEIETKNKKNQIQILTLLTILKYYESSRDCKQSLRGFCLLRHFIVQNFMRSYLCSLLPVLQRSHMEVLFENC